jgi:hypothetical protein
MFVFAGWAATFTQHKLRGAEREHLEAAVQFVRGQERATGVIPESAEFDDWAHAMDVKGYRFEGNGFALDKRCGSKPSEFCIYFSTGDGFVTYRSWQSSMDKVSFDDSPLPLVFGLVFAGLVASTVGKVLLFPRKRMLGRLETHEG